MKKIEILRNKKIEIFQSKKLTFTIIAFAVFSIFVVGVCVARYSNKSILKTNVQVAEPILVLENGNNIQITNENKTGEIQFKVKNYNENNKITEVPLNYNIEVIAKEDEEISYQLIKDNQEINLDKNKTHNIKFDSSEAEEHSYKLKIIYNKGTNNSLSDLMEDIQIKVHSEQVKYDS